MSPSRLARKLRRLADQLEEPVTVPTFEVSVSVLDLAPNKAPGDMRSVVTAYRVLVAPGSVYEAELPVRLERARIQVEVRQV